MEFMNLRQGGTSIREYALKFTKLSKYALSLVADSRAHMNTFTLGVSDLVKIECKAAMLIKEIDISRLMTYAK